MTEPQAHASDDNVASWFLGFALFGVCGALMASTGLATSVSLVWVVLEAV